jgi:kinetochor protein Mis14/NSL1
MTQNTNHTSLRKIELQSPLDLTYLESQARRSARAKIDTALPPSSAAADDDDVRRRVEELVGGYLKRTFDGVRRNVCVNGLDFDDEADGQDRNPDEGVYFPPLIFSCLNQERNTSHTHTHSNSRDPEYEPLNTRLADRIRTLEAQKEKLTESVADLRRDAPAKAAASWRAQWHTDANANADADADADADGTSTRAAQVKAEQGSRSEETDAEGGGLDFPRPRRWGDVQATWERGAEGMVKLKSGLTETGGKLEEARRVVGVLDGE